MLKDLGLDLDLTRSKRPFKVQLALPSKVITQNILNVTTANISDVKLNSLPHFEFEIPFLVESKVNGVTDEIEYIKNPDLDNIKEEKLIKLTWYGGRTNWFRIVTIEKNDSSDGITTKISCDSLESELRTTNVIIDGTGVSTEEYFTKALEDSPWKLGYISEKLKETYRTFSDQEKQTRYEAIQNGIEVYGAITDFDGETRTLNLLTIDELRIFRGVILKRENYASSIDITSTSEEIVTRMYGKGNEDLNISSANPTGMRYIEDFSYFIHPFERDENKNVLHHSAYMSDGLAHALLDLMELEKIYIPKIDELQEKINKAYTDLTTKMTEKVDLDGEMLTLQALLDTAKSTNDKPLIAQRETEIVAKQKQIDDKVAEINALNTSIEGWNKEILDYQELISTNSFTPALVDELKLFVYEKDFSDDRYIDAKELYKATVAEFEKYQKPTRSFKTDLTSFINSIESKKYHGRLEIGEEVKIKSNKLEEEYTSIIIGYSGDLVSGDFQLEISDNMDDIDALDRLATIIYQAESSSSILSNNKYKWNNIVEVKDEVTAWRDKEINTVNNRIVAGANESITIDNRGMMVRNPDFPNEVIIIQSGVVALSKDNGKTWSTSITPNGVIAETLIGKILAGNNLIITNDSGSFVIDNTGMTVKMDSIRIMSGDEGDPKNIIESWNKLLLTYDEIASDSLVNEYEKNQLKLQWNKIEDIHSSMIKAFLKGWSQKPVIEPDPENPNPDPEPDYPEEYDVYIKAYEDLNKYLNTTKQSDGYALLDEANKTKTTTVDPEEFKKKFLDYDKAKQELESIISFTYTHSQIKVLETGISLEYVKNDNIVTALNLSEEGVRIDGKLLEINSKTEFNADLVMNAGVIKGKDDGIIIDLNTGEIKLNKKVTIGAGSNLVTDEDIEPLKGQIVATLSNDMITIFTDPNGASANYSMAGTEMTVYRDGKVDNNNWTFSIEKNDNVVVYQTKNQVVVTSMKTDSEVIVIHAKRGKDVITKEFKIVKFKDPTGNINRWLSIADSIHKSTFDEWVPSEIVALGSQQVVGQDITNYSGRFKVYESTDGGKNFAVQYTSPADASILKYVPTSIDVTHIKVQFYLAGSTLNLIDEQILPVINDQEKSYTHTAYSWSKDGKNDFTIDYPNYNLEHQTRELMDSSNTLYWGTLGGKTATATFELDETPNERVTSAIRFTQTKQGQSGWRSPVGERGGSIPWDTEDDIVLSAYVKNNGTEPLTLVLQIGQSTTEDQKSPIYKATKITIQPNTGWQRISTKLTPNATTRYFWNYVYTDNQTVTADWSMKGYKSEFGILTPWMPTELEAESSDYPMFVGTEVSNRYNGSTNPEDYKWILFRGEDGKSSSAYKAWSWSSDGTDRFTTVYPNVNLLKDSKSQSYISTGTDVNNSPVLYTLDTTLESVQKTQLTISYDYEITGTTGEWSGYIRPTYGLGGVNKSVSNQDTKGSNTQTITTGAVAGSEYRITTSGIPEGATVTITNLKVEFGSVKTLWTPSASEYQANWIDVIPKYIGYSEKNSQIPSDYEWELNIDYVQASSDNGLANKAGIDDLNDVSDIANDALVRAQNSVLTDDYTSWLEHDYQTTIDAMANVSAENKNDIASLDQRQIAVEGFYNDMKVKWNFIDESFTFSEEGMFISNSQSQMAIQITSDKIVFWDNNVDVAFITGEFLNIKRGVFLESATIGNHLITKFSDGSPVTIIRYTGGDN